MKKYLNKILDLRFFILECVNILRLGSNAPRNCELIWVNPNICNYAVNNCAEKLSDMGATIKDGDWDKDLISVNECPNVSFTNLRFLNGIPWDQTGSMEYTMDYLKKYGTFSNISTKEDVISRHKNLDKIFSQVRQERKLKPRYQIDKQCFRETDGIKIHIDRDCKPVFGRAGEHRFSMARILNLQIIPAQVGVIHPKALHNWRKIFQAQNPPSIFDYIDHILKKI